MFSILQSVFALPFLPVGHMQSNQKGRAGDKDQLESPQARVCNWEVVIIADVVATGLAGVAVKVLLLIAPDLLASHEKNQKPKNKNNSEPDATKCCGVFVHSTQETLKKAPVHCAVLDLRHSTVVVRAISSIRMLGQTKLSKCSWV